MIKTLFRLPFLTSARWSLLALVLFLGLNSCGDPTIITSKHPDIASNLAVKNKIPLDGYSTAAKSVATAIEQSKKINNTKGAAKNIILFIGDGMGVSTVTAARILAGQKKGLQGEEYQLSFDKFPFSGFSKTYNTNQQTADSAGTMSAIMTGIKTKAGVISVDQSIERGNCSSMKDKSLVSALELAEISGKATGIVTTTRVTHATPAATYAKSPERNWEGISNLPPSAIKAACKDIADQLVHFESLLELRMNQGKNHPNIDGMEVIMGGGRRHFLRHLATDNSANTHKKIEGLRTDHRNLIEEWKTQYPDGKYIIDKAELDSLDSSQTTKVLGLFDGSHMHYEADRKNDHQGEPSLTQMTSKAIEILKNNKNGFFLMVEAGRIDHGHHAGSAYNALTDTIELSKAVQTALDAVNIEETLIIVTADHSHVFTIGGYPTRGNPILGKVISNDKKGNPLTTYSLAEDGLPFTTLAYRNGRGFKQLKAETNADKIYSQPIDSGRKDLSNIDTTLPGFHQEALVPHPIESHSGEDVGIYAIGPGSHLVTGTHEQNIIFHIMDYAADLSGNAKKAL